jgi:phosphocarrier protein FPr/phosphocarrier protein
MTAEAPVRAEEPLSAVTVLIAPLAGWVLPLEEVPDPVFSQRMMGDGLAIEPLEDVLRAPCDGEVISVAETGHSITLRVANGAELLIHIGLETVALKGVGFSPLAAAGKRVRTGDELIHFDIEAVARRAASLITPIVVASEGYSVASLACNQHVTAGTPLLEIRKITSAAPAPDEASEARAAAQIVIPMAHGLHARPAARIAAALKPFQAEVRIVAGDRAANARSMIDLLTLGLKHGDVATVTGNGTDAAAAVSTIEALIAGGMGDTAVAEASRPREIVEVDARRTGICASPGFAVGTVLQFQSGELEIDEQGAGPDTELAAFERARQELTTDLQANAASGRSVGIAEAHLGLLDDPELLDSCRSSIAAGKSAAFAWASAIRTKADALRATGNRILIERTDDLTDIERRLVAKILGREADAQAIAPGTLLIADTLLPSQFLSLDQDRVAGVVTAGGGPTSHVAILAASAGIPMLVAAGPGVLSVEDGVPAILDADAARFDADPNAAELASAQARVHRQAERHAALAAQAAADCVMADGTRIEVFANLGSLSDAERAVAAGAEGCGLLRTEFLFLDRAEAPSEEEQREVYAGIAEALGGRPLIIRTLDIGGDKPVPYITFPQEDNPALGCRGVRLSLAYPDLLETQLRAILAAVPSAQCRIMLPMIVDVGELRAVKAILARAADAIGMTEKVPLGIMVETPAAALLAESLAEEADFLSVGTNDLSQYALAADRGNQAVAPSIDALHPAVLRLIAEAGRGALAKGRWLGVCGGLASDPKAAAVLIGFGATELSAVPAAVSQVKAQVRELTMERCRALAERAVAAATANEVRALLEGES